MRFSQSDLVVHMLGTPQSCRLCTSEHLHDGQCDRDQRRTSTHVLTVTLFFQFDFFSQAEKN